MKQLSLFDDKATTKATKKTRRTPLCAMCAKSVPPKPRSVMPLTHAIETVQGILISRLDSMSDDIARIVAEEVGEHADCPPRVYLAIAGRLIDALNWRFFPEAYEDGEPYTPDPAGRMDVPTNPVGLIPRRPTIAIYARHLLEVGRSSPAAALRADDGKPLLNEAELVRLGERIEKRQASQKTA